MPKILVRLVKMLRIIWICWYDGILYNWTYPNFYYGEFSTWICISKRVQSNTCNMNWSHQSIQGVIYTMLIGYKLLVQIFGKKNYSFFLEVSLARLYLGGKCLRKNPKHQIKSNYYGAWRLSFFLACNEGSIVNWTVCKYVSIQYY